MSAQGLAALSTTVDEEGHSQLVQVSPIRQGPEVPGSDFHFPGPAAEPVNAAKFRPVGSYPAGLSPVDTDLMLPIRIPRLG